MLDFDEMLADLQGENKPLINVSSMMASAKGIAGSGSVLSTRLNRMTDYRTTMQPGDIAQKDPPISVTAPISYDLWYLYYHNNFLSKYYAETKDFDGAHMDYAPYLAKQLKFLDNLTNVKPLKILWDIDDLVITVKEKADDVFKYYNDYEVSSIYWINLLAFELITKDVSYTYGSDGPKNPPDPGDPFKDLVGYITFPVGQLDTMEVISILQEGDLAGYVFSGGESPSKGGYAPQPPDEILFDEIPLKSTDNPIDGKVTLFPMQSPDLNTCYGTHLVESGYLMAEGEDQQLEFFAVPLPVDKYDDVKPKFWMRKWIHKNDFLPVPGEFVGILCRPVTAPPHLWWFQESTPLVYAGNWMETKHLTSGVVTRVILETNRLDKRTGNLYYVKIQGCQVVVESTDFFTYAVGERVAIVKTKGLETKKAEKSYTWLDQVVFFEKDEVKDDTAEEDLAILTEYVLIPATFYKNPE